MFFQFFGFLFGKIDIVNGKRPETINQYLILSFFNLLGTFLILWIFTKYVDKEKFINLGFTKNIKHIFIGIILGTVVLVFGFNILLYLDELKIITVEFRVNDFLKVFFLFILVSLIEETLFRGYILKNLIISFNKYIALSISSLLFALMHSANPSINLLSFVNLFFAGMLLGTSYIYIYIYSKFMVSHWLTF
ncbi:CPBP family intramembrane metalloprotease [Formosa sediminum]|uniref:CPBP family intramembrane metalloprotease n=1 Tax=Formosa sediminum TaxID=2594004 RepID=A0A516GWA7_9FLAO|nr:CPBP family intramembrane metalloprotease [Formosa sediminum]